MKVNNVLGIIGGSGIYDLDNISNAEWQNVSSKFGEPSDKILTGVIDKIKQETKSNKTTIEIREPDSKKKLFKYDLIFLKTKYFKFLKI